MTTPDERTRAVRQTRWFLQELCDRERTPDVPGTVRQQARWCLRHYPDAGHINFAAVAWRQIWAPAHTTHEHALSYLELLARVREPDD